ncbi:ubiquitin carboxyl-terminal hydrolase 16 isoform X2 [Nerophis lumbriciformis]|uniref:ubiquitin carboxyl-terminal hydrolase 16 isoform X2 n=1 Tax=Nerophis lumbriciformis TaxID=546530 RepID=UPI002AE0423A|nr:ubiquitin carboxyl-terminal hydrolase 16-like isoform X2 [Nerophis lumbriciformis]
MGKKRGKDRSSREKDDSEMNGPLCRHVRKGTDQSILRKIPDASDWTSCQDCRHEDNICADSARDSEDEREAAVWMCMKCAHRGCGRSSEKQHAIKHYEAPRSDPHCLVISLDSWSVWCYECDEEVQYSRTSQLAQLVTSIKKKSHSEPRENAQKDVAVEAGPRRESVEQEEEKENVEEQKSGTEDNSSIPVRGLSNLGNTCFFNAVIQNLSQTRLLRQTLHKVMADKTVVSVQPAATSPLKPVVVQLDQPGSLTVAMYQLLSEIQDSKKGVVTPRELFSQVCKKAARFKGFQQQDSQELLRYLLDGMRAEESKRVNSALTAALKQSEKLPDGEQLKSVVKEYEKNGVPKNFVDHVFGGEMTSTIMCQQCKTVSVVTEMFLDLSLPVSDQAYRKKNQKKAAQKTRDLSEDGGESPSEDVTPGSKHQQKKAKKQAKKQAKHQKRQHKLESRVVFSSVTENPQSEAAQEKGDSGPASPPETEPQVHPEKEDCSPPASNRFALLSGTRRPDSWQEDEDDMDAQLVGEMEKISLTDTFIDSDAMETCAESEDDMSEEAKEYTVVNQDPDQAFQTLASRPAPDQQECSVESCLFHFTQEETLSHNNSLLCVTCSRDKAAGSKKKVYTEALKQMLISTPPPVLTLHLKRFQQNGYSICKVNRHVPFPLLLDIAPFCALKCKNVPEGESQMLYSLYGIVEHSGTMRSGHYTAYVKVPPHGSGRHVAGGGSWFHVSDTSVQPTSESKVQSSQAYLLFYERLL